LDIIDAEIRREILTEENPSLVISMIQSLFDLEYSNELKKVS